MAMVCPRCSQSSNYYSECPTCRIPLLFQAELYAPRDYDDDSSLSWQQTPWGRMLVGIILAQGFAHGLLFVLEAVFYSSAQSARNAFLPMLIWHGIQAPSLVIGGLIAGAGRRKGFVYGSFVGLANSFIFLTIQHLNRHAITEIALIGQPIIHTAFGAVGGFIGWMIWRPLPIIQLQGTTAKQKKSKSTGLGFAFLAGPIHWTRIFAGTGIAVCGVVWAQSILDFVINASGGSLQIESYTQARLILLEITSLAALIGGGVAGATTFNGVKQGMIVGFFGCMGLLGFLTSKPNYKPEIVLMHLICLFFLASVGGWFGRQLFPPIVSYRRKDLLHKPS